MIEVCALTLYCGVQRLRKRVVNHADGRYEVDGESERDANIGVLVNEVLAGLSNILKTSTTHLRISLTVVPSIGSTIKVGASVSLSPGLYVSSPINAKSGYFLRNEADTRTSTALSVSVTRSTAKSNVST